ncbi:sulfotransferase [Palleronia sp.]|uniref:sulfotransferase n=1 Tax=Palleronia sp. TaxID=1940284 RepID=UPI0035C7E254
MPNLFIVGAMKAATTTLADLLATHDAIFSPIQKEPNIFSELDESPRPYYTLLAPKFGSGEPSPISKSPSVCAEEYRDLYRGSEAYRFRLDASTNYLPSPCSAQLIHRVAPDAKIIVLLRNPYERAYSSFAYQLSRGRESAGSFDAAIRHELAGGRSDWAYAWRHVQTSCYDDGISRYDAEFNCDQIKSILFEDFIHDPRSVVDEIADFLKIPTLPEFPERSSNITSLPKTRASRAVKGIFSYGPFRRKMRRFLPRPIQRPVKRVIEANLAWIDARGERPPRPARAALERLALVFEPEITKLECRLQQDLSEWRLPGIRS